MRSPVNLAVSISCQDSPFGALLTIVHVFRSALPFHKIAGIDSDVHRERRGFIDGLATNVVEPFRPTLFKRISLFVVSDESGWSFQAYLLDDPLDHLDPILVVRRTQKAT